VSKNTRGKVFIVTGANTGIGLETARQLALHGAHVVLGCRSLGKAREAAADITASIKRAAVDTLTGAAAADAIAAGPGSVTVLPASLDLSLLSSVRTWVEAFRQSGAPLHGIVCNAGLITSGYQLTDEGVESSFAANHLGHHLLVRLLLPALAETAAAGVRARADGSGRFVTAPGPVPAAGATSAAAAVVRDTGRVVIVSSSLHKNASAAAAAVQPTAADYSPFATYARCKLANLLFARKLQQFVAASTELRGLVSVYTLHPGNPVTNFTSNLAGPLRFLEAAFLPLMYLWRETPHAGAFTSVYAATAPGAPALAGLYLIDSAPAPRSPEAENQAAADALWRHSEELCDLK
jgi:WW domain-containing oxidoreductase